jgi:transcriptional regulator with XRE-family HTH domain
MDKILKSASTVKIGKRFSNKRISLGLSLEEASKILFINEDYLKAIEKGDYSIFPSESFARAYFKKYSQYLKIKADLPDIFNLHTENKIPKKASKIENISSLNNDNFNYIYKVIPILIVLGALVAIYFVEFGNTKKSQREFMSTDQQITYLFKTIDQKNNPLTGLKDLTSKNELYLDFLGECWIELYVDDELIEALYFNENDSYKKKIDRPFKIIVGNAEAINGTYNGNEIDFMANANRLTKVNIINFDENKLD